MKISVITLHRVFNYGSVLQTYATQELFKKCGFEVEIIDYIPLAWQNKALFFNIANKRNFIYDSIYRILKFFSVLLKKRTFWSFLKRNLNMTCKYFSLRQLKDNPPNGDIYCSGSDQIWNSTYNGIDGAFYLQFGKAETKRVSFSSSIGKTELPQEEKNIAGSYLKQYSAVSVRENSAKLLLEDMGINSEVLLDPTLQIPKEQWISMASQRLIKEKYLVLMLLYNEDNNATEYARKIADAKGLKLVKISWELKKPPMVDVLMSHRTPEDFLSLIYHSDYVVTNSFHGLAFSINLNKQFSVVKRNEFNSRIESLLDLTELRYKLIDNELNMNDVNKVIDYSNVNDILTKERKRTEDFINQFKN